MSLLKLIEAYGKSRHTEAVLSERGTCQEWDKQEKISGRLMAKIKSELGVLEGENPSAAYAENEAQNHIDEAEWELEELASEKDELEAQLKQIVTGFAAIRRLTDEGV